MCVYTRIYNRRREGPVIYIVQWVMALGGRTTPCTVVYPSILLVLQQCRAWRLPSALHRYTQHRHNKICSALNKCRRKKKKRAKTNQTRKRARVSSFLLHVRRTMSTHFLLCCCLWCNRRRCCGWRWVVSGLNIGAWGLRKKRKWFLIISSWWLHFLKDCQYRIMSHMFTEGMARVYSKQAFRRESYIFKFLPQWPILKPKRMTMKHLQCSFNELLQCFSSKVIQFFLFLTGLMYLTFFCGNDIEIVYVAVNFTCQSDYLWHQSLYYLWYQTPMQTRLFYR